MALTKISTDGVKDDAVTAGKIPANAVGSSELADNAVDTNAIQDDAVTTDHIINSAITSAKIADGTISTVDIADHQITDSKLASNSVTTARINGSAVTTAKIADQAVTLAKLPHGDGSSDGKFLRANNGADPTFETVSTDLVADTSPQLGGDLDTNSHHILIDDDHQVRFGDGNDFNINHNGTDTYLTNSTGNLIVQQAASNTSGDTYSKARTHYIRVDGNDSGIDVIQNGAVNLYYNNTKRVYTSPGGLQIDAAGSNPIITNTNSPVYANAGLELHRGGNGYCNARFASNYGTTLSLAGISNTNTTEFSFIQDNSGNAYVRNEHTNPIRFQIGSSGLSSSNTMVMNNGGEVQVPRQPFFWAYNSSNYSWNNNTISFETEANDVGGNYNNSTYTFTCPTAGVYMFVVYFRAGGGFGEFSWTLQKNGGNFIRIIGQGSFSGNDCHYGTTIQKCSVNDSWRVHGSGSHGGATGGYQYNGFQGYLLG